MEINKSDVFLIPITSTAEKTKQNKQKQNKTKQNKQTNKQKQKQKQKKTYFAGCKLPNPQIVFHVQKGTFTPKFQYLPPPFHGKNSFSNSLLLPAVRIQICLNWWFSTILWSSHWTENMLMCNWSCFAHCFKL